MLFVLQFETIFGVMCCYLQFIYSSKIDFFKFPETSLPFHHWLRKKNCCKKSFLQKSNIENLSHDKNCFKLFTQEEILEGKILKAELKQNEMKQVWELEVKGHSFITPLSSSEGGRLRSQDIKYPCCLIDNCCKQYFCKNCNTLSNEI